MVVSLGCIWLRAGPCVHPKTVQKKLQQRKQDEWQHGLATTSIERVAQGLGTLPEAEASCLLAFPMVYLPIAASLGRLRPDLALGRLGAGMCEEEREAGWWRREPK